MIDDTIYNLASSADAGDHCVHVHGPSNVDVNLTPAAAFETATRINKAAINALMNALPPAPYIYP